ncbi:MAG: hypothetical protein ABIN89_28395 [Chitinophagaceae bacterium]
MEKSIPLSVYQERITDLTINRNQLKKKRSIISWLRFVAIIVIIASFYYLKPYGLLYAFGTAIFFTAIFLRLIILSSRNNDKISNLDLLLTINQQELDIASGKYYDFPGGTEHLPALHDYAQDLDIFGRASLYQYINRTTSEQGHKTLALWLLRPSSSTEILERQESAKELNAQYQWRQQLHAYGLANKVTTSTQTRIDNWLKEDSRFAAAHWKWIRYIFPAIILSALVCMLIGLLPSELFWGAFFIFLVIALSISRRVVPVYLQLDKIVKQAETLSNSLAWIEQQPFQTPLLKKLQAKYKIGSTYSSKEVVALKEILARFDLRLNPILFIFLNTLLFWDLQQVLQLEKWKERNSKNVQSWFSTLGMLEALSSIATIFFNHPDWTFPVIDEKDGSFIADELGHPLIPASKRVCSSFATRGSAKLALITGSNMAGKSTFLRSVGVNIVLAMMGAPVCAKNFTVSNMRVISSMRIADNLEENTSTFYAELKKLKYIIEAVNNQEKVFLLLDEILRGTNSLDRQQGSKALIRQLIRHKAVGMLATHDLDLANLVEEYPTNIHNYHFDVQVDNEELYFDYKLKEGVCQSLNASILMKKIGIEL